DIAALIERAGRFLDEWPQSARRPSVLMVLGEAHFRGGDYPGAILVFQRLATESPGSPFAEPARFFAGKAASLTQSPENRALALEIWEEIARSGGALASAARHEQGLLKLARDDLDGAIETFDALLAMPAGALAVDRRLAVLCDLGQAWFMKASASPATPHAETGDASEPLRSAIAAFETVEKDPEASRAWRFQAAVRHGKCLELLGEKASALEVYYDVVRSGRPTAPLASIPVAEFDWYFRAGIAAVELLRSQENWRGAVRIAEQLARAGGSRAAEAARIAENLRLRHFLWDEPEG
ncbi:MAG: tetratricopeptide repeat protein, partial [Verrucomicrobiae bacterium]|nr:tetratricopeptide repeat protein [Verrucomicrobiae bacterium]